MEQKPEHQEHEQKELEKKNYSFIREIVKKNLWISGACCGRFSVWQERLCWQEWLPPLCLSGWCLWRNGW